MRSLSLLLGVVDYSHTFLAADSVVKPLVSKYLVPPCIGLGVGPRLSGFITHTHMYTNCGLTESIVKQSLSFYLVIWRLLLDIFELILSETEFYTYTRSTLQITFLSN